MKLFLITLTDGTQHRIAIGGDGQHIGKPLNHVENIGAAVNIARSGFCLDPKAAQPTVVAPSQIKSVQLVNE